MLKRLVRISGSIDWPSIALTSHLKVGFASRALVVTSIAAVSSHKGRLGPRRTSITTAWAWSILARPLSMPLSASNNVADLRVSKKRGTNHQSDRPNPVYGMETPVFRTVPRICSLAGVVFAVMRGGQSSGPFVHVIGTPHTTHMATKLAEFNKAGSRPVGHLRLARGDEGRDPFTDRCPTLVRLPCTAVLVPHHQGIGAVRTNNLGS